MSLLTKLSEVFGDAFAAAGIDRGYGEVVVAQRQDLAQFQCNGALAAAKPAGRNPRELAQEVLDRLADRTPFSELSIAGPGFINITLQDDYLAAHIDGVERDDRLGVPAADPPTPIVVDYGGPNVAKDLHVGHLRPAIIGESIKRTLRWAGHDVTGDVHLGDWGTPQGQLIVELRDRHPDWIYFDPLSTGPYPEESPVEIDDLQEIYPVASQKAKQDLAVAEEARLATVELQDGRPGYLALWQHMRDVSVDAIRTVYDELGVEFDFWYGESSTAHLLDGLVRRAVESGIAVESSGAIVVDVSEPDDRKEIPPCMLVKSDGATLYTTWDIATIADRVQRLGAREIIYVVDVRQSLHFEQVFRAARRLGVAGPEIVLEHAGNGTVNGPDGKPFKTRDGGLLRLRELIDMVVARAAKRLEENEIAVEYGEEERAEIARTVGLAAVKYGDLSNHRATDYVFDLERFTSFEGKTGPYLLYGAVRIKSILRRAEEEGLAPGAIVPAAGPHDRGLMLQLARLPEILDRAIQHRAPNHLAEYAYEVVTEFNRFYESCHILREPDGARQASWLALVDLTLRQLTLLLDLLVIEIPERM